MERSKDGDAQKDIFAADAVGFQQSSTVVVSVITVLVILGTLYQIYKYREGKEKGQGKTSV